MAADQEVMRQFLISLGFQVDQTAMGKFLGGIHSVTKGAQSAGVAIIGVAAAAQAMVAAYSSSMEKLYYSSKRTGSSVENLMNLESGSKRIGLAAGQAQAALEAMAAAVRTSPGKRGLMNTLIGEDSSKMDQTKAMLELVKKLSTMPHHVGASFAQIFGMDEQTFLMMKQGLPEMEAAMERHNKLLRQAGIDADAAAAASKEYMNTLRDLGEKVNVLGLKMSIKMLPAFRATTTAANKILDKAIEKGVLGREGGFRQLGRSLNEWLSPGYKEWAAKKDTEYANRKGRDTGNKKITMAPGVVATPATAAIQAPPAPPPPASRASAPVSTTGTSKAGQIFNELEAKYKLPAGTLDAIWNKESARGTNMVGPVTKTGERALGHFQFMKATAKEYGVNDPNDLQQSATGAAKYMGWLLKRYNGNLKHALAAYNGGPGTFDKAGALGKMPRESQKYAESISKAIQIHQKTEINVNGAGDSKAVAGNVLAGQERVNGDIVRNMRSAVQ